MVSREIEWGTVLLGFEQANKYTVKNELGETVALMAEEQTGSMSFIGRQLLGRYRSFTATVFDPSGAHLPRPLVCRTSRKLVSTANPCS